MECGIGLESYELLRDVRSLLRYHVSSGIVDYLADEQIDRFIRSNQVSIKGSGNLSNKRLVQKIDKSPTQVQSTKGEVSQISMDLANIKEEILSCSACELTTKRRFSLEGRGSMQARLLIVGEYLSLPSDVENEGELLFGVEEDLMLSRMMSAINLKEEDVFITNIIKCGLGLTPMPDRKNFESCMPFLRRQISVVRPEVICVMGTLATQLLLNSSRSLSQLRGRFHYYKDKVSGLIPVMPTYHPAYLIKNQEMKKVTWLDLQVIARRLTEKG